MSVDRQPVYSLGAKLEGAGKATKTPGPATYPPNLYNVKKVRPSTALPLTHESARTFRFTIIKLSILLVVDNLRN